MRILLFVTALAACEEQGMPELSIYGDQPPIVHTTADAGIQQQAPQTIFSRPSGGANSDIDLCKLLPDDDSACAHACDPAALKTYIPAGTCASFTCTLTDGSLFRIGGCNT